jgi:hypothetical protein
MWDTKIDFFLIIVSKGTRGTELPPPFWVLIYFQYNFFIISSLFPEFIVDDNSIYRVDTCSMLLTYDLHQYGYAQVKLRKMGWNKEILLKINM